MFRFWRRRRKVTDSFDPDEHDPDPAHDYDPAVATRDPDDYTPAEGVEADPGDTPDELDDPPAG